VDRRAWIWIAAIVVVIAGLLRWMPLALVLVAPALLVGGISARRHSQDPGTRALGEAAIAGGATGLAVLALVGLYLLVALPVRTSSGVTVEPLGCGRGTDGDQAGVERVRRGSARRAVTAATSATGSSSSSGGQLKRNTCSGIVSVHTETATMVTNAQPRAVSSRRMPTAEVSSRAVRSRL